MQHPDFAQEAQRVRQTVRRAQREGMTPVRSWLPKPIRLPN